MGYRSRDLTPAKEIYLQRSMNDSPLHMREQSYDANFRRDSSFHVPPLAGCWKRSTINIGSKSILMNTSSLVLQPPIQEAPKKPLLRSEYSLCIDEGKKFEVLPAAFKTPKYSFKVEGFNSFTFTKPYKAAQSHSIIEIPRPVKPYTAAVFKKTPEEADDIRITAFKVWCERITASNGLVLTQIEGNSKYKFYLHKGNNSQLIATLMKQRWWWARTDDPRQANFVWTPIRKKSIFKNLDRVGPKNHIAQLGKPFFGRIRKECARTGYSAVIEAEKYSYLQTEAKDSRDLRTYNKLDRNIQLTTKKRLFVNLKIYCQQRSLNVFDIVPLTFCVKGINDSEFAAFENSFRHKEECQEENVWIVKPGEFTNRGNGIKVFHTLYDVKAWVSQSSKTCIVQEYVSRPLLIQRRKFDIRAYAMLTSVNGRLQGYWYRQGYLRTSSRDFSLKSKSKYIHLTNDAVQKKAEDYGRFEAGNKVRTPQMSYTDFQRYLDVHLPESKVDVTGDILTQIKNIVSITMEAVADKVDPQRYMSCFEVFGYDFLVDENFKVWLLEVNTNPCLELGCCLLSALIPNMLDNALR